MFFTLYGMYLIYFMAKAIPNSVYLLPDGHWYFRNKSYFFFNFENIVASWCSCRWQSWPAPSLGSVLTSWTPGSVSRGCTWHFIILHAYFASIYWIVNKNRDPMDVDNIFKLQNIGGGGYIFINQINEMGSFSSFSFSFF